MVAYQAPIFTGNPARKIANHYTFLINFGRLSLESHTPNSRHATTMVPEDFRDYYADLGLKPNASHASIKAAFHTLAKQHHPDKSGISDATAFRRAREAYEKLTDASYRSAYDKSYWHTKLQTDGRTDADGASDEGLGYTRTAQYEQEEERGPPSPPPTKPVRKPREPSWLYFNSKPYVDWQKKDNEHRMRHPERNEV